MTNPGLMNLGISLSVGNSAHTNKSWLGLNHRLIIPISYLLLREQNGGVDNRGMELFKV